MFSKKKKKLACKPSNFVLGVIFVYLFVCLFGCLMFFFFELKISAGELAVHWPRQRHFICMYILRPIYTVRFLLTIVVCDFYSARCSRHGKIVYDFHDVKLHVATIVLGF